MSSLISQITERVAGLEASLRALESDRAQLRSRNAELQGELELARGQIEELRLRCEALGRESAEAQQLASDSSVEAVRWRDAYARLRTRLRAIVDESTADGDERQSVQDDPTTPLARESSTGEQLWADDGDATRLPTETAVRSPEAPRMWEIVAYPFERFAELRVFQEAIRGLDGTREVRLLHFDKGTLELSVDYDGAVPLQQAMSGLEAFPGVVSEDERGRLVYRRQLREDLGT